MKQALIMHQKYPEAANLDLKKKFQSKKFQIPTFSKFQNLKLQDKFQTKGKF